MQSLKDENYNVGHKSKEISLKEYYDIIKKRLWIILIITTLATIVGYFYSNVNNTLLYESSRRIIIKAEDENMSTLMVLITDKMTTEKVKEDLKLDRSTGALAGQTTVSQIDDSEVISIAVTDTDPVMAATIANTIAEAFKSQAAEVIDFEGVQLLAPAEESHVPLNPTTNRPIVIGLVFGLITGIGLVFLLDSLDNTVHKEREIEEILGVPVLGVISNMNRVKRANRKDKESGGRTGGETIGTK